MCDQDRDQSLSCFEFAAFLTRLAEGTGWDTQQLAGALLGLTTMEAGG
jgi:hypothetical protein